MNDKIFVPEPKCCVLIPAAGSSGRMGVNKALLPYGNGLTFAGQLVSAYLDCGFSNIVMVVNKDFSCSFPGSGQVRFVINNQVEKGRSWSVLLGLKHIPSEYACFIQNIDNPYVPEHLLVKMTSVVTPSAYVVPVFEGNGGHPVLLGSAIADRLRGKQEITNLRDALRDYERLEVVSPDNRILLNINTPKAYHDFIRAEKII